MEGGECIATTRDAAQWAGCWLHAPVFSETTKTAFFMGDDLVLYYVTYVEVEFL